MEDIGRVVVEVSVRELDHSHSEVITVIMASLFILGWKRLWSEKPNQVF